MPHRRALIALWGFTPTKKLDPLRVLTALQALLERVASTVPKANTEVHSIEPQCASIARLANLRHEKVNLFAWIAMSARFNRMLVKQNALDVQLGFIKLKKLRKNPAVDA